MGAGVNGGRAQRTEGRGGREPVARQARGNQSAAPDRGTSEGGVEILTVTDTASFRVAADAFWLTLKVHLAQPGRVLLS